MLQLRGIYRNGSVELLEPMPDEREREVVVTVVGQDERPTEYEKQLAKEKRAYLQQHDQLLRTHQGKYVAMRNGVVVDEADDSGTLYKRIRAQYGDAAVLITKVTEQPIRKARVISPRIVR